MRVDLHDLIFLVNVKVQEGPKYSYYNLFRSANSVSHCNAVVGRQGVLLRNQPAIRLCSAQGFWLPTESLVTRLLCPGTNTEMDLSRRISACDGYEIPRATLSLDTCGTTLVATNGNQLGHAARLISPCATLEFQIGHSPRRSGSLL